MTTSFSYDSVLPIRYRNTGLYVVPSIHNDLMFADPVYRAILREYYDVIALELSRDISPSELVAVVERIWPAPGVAFVRGNALGVRRFPTDDQLRQVSSLGSLLPIMPCDSIIAALHAFAVLAKKDRHRLPLLEFCDLPVRFDSKQSRKLRRLADSWLVAKRGLSAYLQIVKRTCEEGRLAIDDARELVMAAALKRHLAEGRRVLFVCGLAHWDRIAALLDAGVAAVQEPSISAPASYRKLESFSIGASEAWWVGWMGIPAVVADFVHHVKAASADTAGFDIPAAIARLRQKALVQARDIEDQPISVRTCLAFESYLEAKLSLGKKWVVELDSDLCESAKICVSEEFAKTIKETALAYPFVPPRRVPAAQLVKFEDETFLVAGENAFLLHKNNAPFEDGESRSLPLSRTSPLSKSEARKAGMMPIIRSIPAEDALQKQVIEHAWSLGDHYSRQQKARKPEVRATLFSGDLGRGIHWRKTEEALADGAPEGCFYVKIPTRRRISDSARDVARGGTQCPVVWVFTPEAPVVSRVSGTFHPSGVYSSFYWLASTSRVPEARITRESVAFGINILRGRSSWNETAVRQLIASLPESQQPRIKPWCDPELRGFTGPELTVAAGIKHAADRVIVVADSRFPLGRQVKNYAHTKKVEIVRVPWEMFGWEVRRRLALQHTGPSMDAFADPEPFILRQIPPVPEFCQFS